MTPRMAAQQHSPAMYEERQSVAVPAVNVTPSNESCIFRDEVATSLETLEAAVSRYKQQQILADNQTDVAGRLSTVRSQIAASNNAIARAVDSLNASELRQQADDRALKLLDKRIDELVRQRDPSRMTAAELAECMDLSKASEVRRIIWTKSNSHIAPGKPQPPIPDDLPRAPKRSDESTQEFKKRKDESISSRVDKKGVRQWRLRFKWLKLDFSNDSIKDGLKFLVGTGIGAAALKAIQHALGG